MPIFETKMKFFLFFGSEMAAFAKKIFVKFAFPM